ncbi:MAG: 16S rRNA (guanine(527)-N(7))-methyltransferase RsmG [Chloroflexota bacterium]
MTDQRDLLDDLGTPLTAAQIALLRRHCTLVAAANDRMNLTTVTEPAVMWTRHVLDSLRLLKGFPSLVAESGRARLADVGSGAGFPGIPLAVALPETQVCLFEATGKKARFLTETVAELGLRNVSVAAIRVEDAGLLPEHREGYDVVVARALAGYVAALELCAPLAKQGGRFVLARGTDAVTGHRLASGIAPRLGLRVLTPLKVAGPEEGRETWLALADKVGPTPRGFPRRPGMASRRPLE